MKRGIALCAAIAVFLAAQIPLSDRQGCEDVACTETEALLVRGVLPVLIYGSFLVAAILAVSLLLDRSRVSAERRQP